MKTIQNLDFYEIPNLEGYLINENGEVFSEKSGKTLKVTNGVVEVYVDGIKKKLNVAHLVLLTFVGNPDNAKRVRFKNGDKSDASLANVEWVIPKTRKSATTKSSSKSTSSRVKEIAKRRKELEKEMKALEKEESTITKKDSIETLAKDNMTSIIDGMIKGETVSTITQRVLGVKLTREVLSKLVLEQYKVSLREVITIAKLQKAYPKLIKGIFQLHKSKLSNVVFSNVA
jgi:hypothetical protein